MGDSIQTVVVDTALAQTDIEDCDVLEALCDTHLSATEYVCKNHGGASSVGNDLLDFEEYLGVGRAL